MAENSKIEWTTHTFNPWRGCTKISAGCANCHADSQAKINPRVLGIWGANGTRIVASQEKWNEPIKWNRLAACVCRKSIADAQHEAGCPQRERPRVFCASMADVFEDWPGRMKNSSGLELWGNKYSTEYNWEPATDEQDYAAHHTPVTMQDVRNRLYRLIDSTLNIDYLIVTKRPENAPKMIPPRDLGPRDEAIFEGDDRYYNADSKFIRSNVWYGTSVENQKAAEERIPHLLKIPAKIRFLSVEPLLGPVDLLNFLSSGGIHWVIIGGESGQDARPCYWHWIRDTVTICQRLKIPVFVKQFGSNSFRYNHNDGSSNRVYFKHPKGGDLIEWPEFAKVREFPTV